MTSDVHATYARVLWNYGDRDGAVAIFREREELNEMDKVTYSIWIDLLWEDGRIKEARNLFSKSGLSFPNWQENGANCLDLHGCSGGGSAAICLETYIRELAKKTNGLPIFIVAICGKGLHSKDKEIGSILRKFLLENFDKIRGVEKIEEDPHNLGKLNVFPTFRNP